jgi:hypothetical protein
LNKIGSIKSSYLQLNIKHEIDYIMSINMNLYEFMCRWDKNDLKLKKTYLNNNF